MFRKFEFSLLGVAALMATGCASEKLVGGEVALVNASALPPPGRADLAQEGRPYVLGPADKINVEVFGIEDLSRSVQVDPSGFISLPMAGLIQVNGRTAPETAQLVAERLRAAHVRNPRVTVNLVEAVSQTITVGGEVEEPGVYPVQGKLTLMRAIARAKGATEFARQNHVVVFRTVDGKRLAALYDLRAIRAGIYQDPEVYANDVVEVGESRARRVFKDIIQSSALITTPIIALVQARP